MSEESIRHFLASLDRAAHQRGDVQWLQKQLANSARFIFVWNDCNLFSVVPEKRPLFLEGNGTSIPLNPIFLGLRANGDTLFAVDLSTIPTEEGALASLALDSNHARFVPLRQFAGPLSAEDRSLLFYSRSLTHWQREQRFCNRCGSPTVPEEAGHVMACTNPECAAKHFPRTDPATIMLVHDGDRCLLGRQSSWPEGMYSTLAGFVEPGESLEEAVFREVKEESGIEVKNIHYFGSQPWPFPQSLMLGFVAEAATREITRGAELEDVRWFNVSEARALVRKLAGRFPHLDTIARRLIRHWVSSKGEVEDGLLK